MFTKPVVIEFKSIEACRHDGPARTAMFVYTRADEVNFRGQVQTYKKVVDIREAQPTKAGMKQLMRFAKANYSNIVDELDLTPAQADLFV